MKTWALGVWSEMLHPPHRWERWLFRFELAALGALALLLTLMAATGGNGLVLALIFLTFVAEFLAANLLVVLRTRSRKWLHRRFRF